MKKYTFRITAHVGDNAMIIYSRTYDYNYTENYDSNPVLRMVSRQMPCINHWDEDDGNDKPGTSYCQYVHYEPCKGNYLLAAWYEK